MDAPHGPRGPIRTAWGEAHHRLRPRATVALAVRSPILTLIILILSLLYWQLVSLWGDVDEAWDAAAYWTVAYPLSILFAGGAGWIIRRHGWAAGMMISLAQWPIMATQESGETQWAIGLVFLLPLSMPHGAAAFIAGRLKQRWHQRR